MSSVVSTSSAFVAKSPDNIVEANITPFHDGADSNESNYNSRGVAAGDNAAPDILKRSVTRLRCRDRRLATCPSGAARLEGGNHAIARAQTDLSGRNTDHRGNRVFERA